MIPRTLLPLVLATVVVPPPAFAQHRAVPQTPAASPPSPSAPVSSAPPTASESSADAAPEATDPHASFSLRLDRGHGPEYPRADYSRATVRVVPILQRNRPAYQLYGRARFYTLDGAFHDLSCSFIVYADGATMPTPDYACRERSGELDLANVEGMQLVSLTDTHVEFRIATAAMISSPRVYRDIVFRLDAPGGELLTPSRAYRP